MVSLLGLRWKNFEKRTISLSQKAYVEKVLYHTEISVFKPVHSLIVWIDFKKNLEVPADEELVRFYQSHADTHMWAYFCTRPDLGFAVSTLSRSSSNPTPEHMAAYNEYIDNRRPQKI